jgi:hypothetical protein
MPGGSGDWRGGDDGDGDDDSNAEGGDGDGHHRGVQ